MADDVLDDSVAKRRRLETTQSQPDGAAEQVVDDSFAALPVLLVDEDNIDGAPADGSAWPCLSGSGAPAGHYETAEISFPSYTNVGKLIGKQGSSIDALKQRFGLSKLEIKTQQKRLHVQGTNLAIQELRQNLRLEGAWPLENENKDYDYWKEYLQAHLKDVPVRMVYDDRVQRTDPYQSLLAVRPRTKLLIEGTLQQLGEANQIIQKLEGFCAVVRAQLDDAKRFEVDNSKHKQAVVGIMEAEGVQSQGDSTQDPCFLLLRGPVGACCRAKAELAWHLVREQQPVALRGCYLPTEVPDHKAVFSRFFQDVSSYGNLHFDVAGNKKHVTVAGYLPKDLSTIRFHTEKVLSRLQVISGIVVPLGPHACELDKNLPAIKEEFNIEVRLLAGGARQGRKATVVGLLPSVKDGINHLLAEASPKPWKLCTITPSILAKFRTPETCRAAVQKAVKDAGFWWSTIVLGPTEEDLLYLSTLKDARDVAKVVATRLEIQPHQLLPKDIYLEMQLGRRYGAE
eukprot:TRINITY_DN93425_c0_g1_i1.p1 TRINITY_DN93425_c0_g1~~TRINITY_DN93425_c0_g1_i1.p1  ORF type:complete len:513 (+),score=66.31 TRINITY_DN93425_c0_g1_i1:39-1577(+)